MPLFPIGFSIHDSKIVSNIQEKSQLLAPLIPGDVKTYIYRDEKTYYDDYKKSWFGITHKKAGWDCMRHYEILACGCIPLFKDLESCPNDTMTFFPKNIILETNELYKEMQKSLNDYGQIDQSLKNKALGYIEKLLTHTRNFLTNKKMAEYILNKINLYPTKILFLSKDINADYLRCETLVGFKQVFGSNCHDYPKIPHIYKQCPENIAKTQYGYGISYTQLIDDNQRDPNYDLTLEKDIKDHVYDIIIYGSYHRGMLFWDIVNSVYKKNEIILICGEDIHYCNSKDIASSGYNVFLRESHVL